MKQIFETHHPYKDALVRGVPAKCVLVADDGDLYIVLFEEDESGQEAIRLGKSDQPWTADNFISLSDEPVAFGHLDEFGIRPLESMSVHFVRKHKDRCGCTKFAGYSTPRRGRDAEDTLLCQHYLVRMSDPDTRCRWELYDFTDPDEVFFQSYRTKPLSLPVRYLHRDWDGVIASRPRQPRALRNFVKAGPDEPLPLHRAATFCAQDWADAIQYEQEKTNGKS